MNKLPHPMYTFIGKLKTYVLINQAFVYIWLLKFNLFDSTILTAPAVLHTAPEKRLRADFIFHTAAQRSKNPHPDTAPHRILTGGDSVMLVLFSSLI